MKVALFTCFNPCIGGGSVLLRRIIALLPEIEFTWYYLRGGQVDLPRSVYLGEPLIGGNPIADLIRSARVWTTRVHPFIDEWVTRILQAGADVHWIVGMNEGFPVGLALHRRAPKVPIHVSIQDDQEFGMFWRSRRYMLMARCVRSAVTRLLREAVSIDVISDGMRAYCRQRFGRKATIVRHIVTECGDVVQNLRHHPIKVGHIGALYNEKPFIAFLRAIRRECVESTTQFRVVMIGCPRKTCARLSNRSGVRIDCVGELEEEEAIKVLANCTFLYAMYPFDSRSEVFRRTSLPTKVSTYVRCQRPVFAHTPSKSSLARLIRRFRIGLVCSSLDNDVISEAIRATACKAVPSELFNLAQADYYGMANVDRMRSALINAMGRRN